MSVANGWTLVVAISENGVIGRGDQLPWRLSSDLQRFKSMTMGHCLLMGRKTFESIGRPLPGRQTIVLSRNGYRTEFEAVKVTDDLEQVNGLVEPGRQVMVVGGAEVYKLALPYCDSLWLTRVHGVVEGDVYFPEIDWDSWVLTSKESYPAGPKDEWETEFQVWRRKTIL